MRLFAFVAFATVCAFSTAQGENDVQEYGECQEILSTDFCVNATLNDCTSVSVRLSVPQFLFVSPEFELRENLEICLNVSIFTDQEPCRFCAFFDDVDATSVGATFDPVLRIADVGPCAEVPIDPQIAFPQVQIGSDCGDYLDEATCLNAAHACGWCLTSQSCEPVDLDQSPHCSDCAASEWVIPGSGSGPQPGENNPNGPTSEEDARKRNLAYGLGIGIPLALAAGVCVFIVYRRNKKLGNTGYDFQRNREESQSTGHGTTILIPDNRESSMSASAATNA